MSRLRAQSVLAVKSYAIIEHLQAYFVAGLTQKGKQLKTDFVQFKPVEWLRDQGIHGGGCRMMATDALFNRASVNLSQVFYEDKPEKPLNSATAISTIIHPAHPLSPSMHMHISFTEHKNGKGYWRLMADLNPSNEDNKYKTQFENAIKQTTDDLFEFAQKQGNEYFFIPALKRHRGISHFYLEQHDSGDWTVDSALAIKFGESVIDTYCDIFYQSNFEQRLATLKEQRKQLDYHSLYFLQVLTLDRGTTSGLLAHNQNDVGTLGSIPSTIDTILLKKWIDILPEAQQPLMFGLLSVLDESEHCLIGNKQKQDLVDQLRIFYKSYPQAINFQAKGFVVPPTVQNHNG
ncbi:MAG: coproporphyrinogen III oxidase [Saccharospirillaceae bacterium]|nr:coproporphyrinogen III oxidase [Pseudomonadales bacterium]NRB80138.1 coproporphyrinogen III oxidase [Saccharospirillaceae bacterium]